jgi:hypothetical protein
MHERTLNAPSRALWQEVQKPLHSSDESSVAKDMRDSTDETLVSNEAKELRDSPEVVDASEGVELHEPSLAPRSDFGLVTRTVNSIRVDRVHLQNQCSGAWQLQQRFWLRTRQRSLLLRCFFVASSLSARCSERGFPLTRCDQISASSCCRGMDGQTAARRERGRQAHDARRYSRGACENARTWQRVRPARSRRGKCRRAAAARAAAAAC